MKIIPKLHNWNYHCLYRGIQCSWG